ncbi:MAG: Stp1/IreP family PP2C-type Ser/Thr phosphatase [Bacteroidota bacterium]
MRYTFFEKTDVGRVRQANEDSIGHLETEWGLVLILCDGMGGHRGGATASQLAVRCIREYFSSYQADADEVTALRNAVSFANEQIYATAVNEPELKGMGTTCVVVLVKGEQIWIAHVGDSRAYLYADQRLKRLTRDHSFVQGLVDQGVITDEEAERHPRKNELMLALGIRPEVEVTVTEKPILPVSGDRFLICSDGLNGMINDREIASCLKNHLDLAQLGTVLIERANENGGTDNISVQVLRIDASPHRRRTFVPILPPMSRRTTDPRSQPVEGIPSEAKKLSVQWNRVLPVLGILAVLLVAVLVLTPLGGAEPDPPPNEVELSEKMMEKVQGFLEKLEAKATPECKADFRAFLEECGDGKINTTCLAQAWKVKKSCNLTLKSERTADPVPADTTAGPKPAN